MTEKKQEALGIAGTIGEDGELRVDSVSIVSVSCLLCHVQVGGGWFTDTGRPTEHDPGCPKRGKDSKDA